jgi:chaperonin cofactor prefoldin
LTFVIKCVILISITTKHANSKEDNMTKEEEIYYRNYGDLFRSAGWAQMVDELKDREEAYDIGFLRDEKDLFKTQGELSIIRMLLNFEQYIEQGLESATNPTA